MNEFYKDCLEVNREGDIWVLYRISNNTKCPIYKDKNIKNIRKLLPSCTKSQERDIITNINTLDELKQILKS